MLARLLNYHCNHRKLLSRRSKTGWKENQAYGLQAWDQPVVVVAFDVRGTRMIVEALFYVNKFAHVMPEG